MVTVTSPLDSVELPPPCVSVSVAPAGMGHDGVTGIPESAGTSKPVLDASAPPSRASDASAPPLPLPFAPAESPLEDRPSGKAPLGELPSSALAELAAPSVGGSAPMVVRSRVAAHRSDEPASDHATRAKSNVIAHRGMVEI